MTADWRPLFAVPCGNYGQATIRLVTTLVTAAGYSLDDADIGTMVRSGRDGENQQWSVVSVPSAAEPRFDLSDDMAAVWSGLADVENRVATIELAAELVPVLEPEPDTAPVDAPPELEAGPPAAEDEVAHWEVFDRRVNSRVCPDCGRTLDNSHIMERHRTTDDHGPGAARCDVDGCGWVFGTTVGLNRHRARTHDLKPAPVGSPLDAPLDGSSPAATPGGDYQCDGCDEAFTSPAEVIRHALHVHGRQATIDERSPAV